MKKFKNIFLVTLLIDLLTAITLFLFLFNPEMMEEAVYSQFEGINQAGKDALYLIHIVFACIIISMIIATAVAMKIKIKESAQTAALILFIIHIGWILPDILNFVSGNAHPPIFIMVLSAIPILALGYAWKNGEV
tara:strand:+ start:184 stop:588 length:405 start_codon:yes stop_codon:yes gene_type:complete